MAGVKPNFHKPRKYVRGSALLLCFVFVPLVYLLGSIHDVQFFRYDEDVFTTDKTYYGPYLPDTEGCRIPDMSPYHKTILRYLKPAEPIICSRHAPLTYTTVEGGRQVLKIDTAMVKHYAPSLDRLHCCYAVVTRVTDETNKEGNCTEFTKQVILNIKVDLIYVRCIDVKNKKQLYANVHAVVQVKPLRNTFVNGDEVKSGMKEELPNVLLLGIDSISRLNLRRTMPRTVSYIRSNNWAELRKYNKIGDNTLPNLMAILTGRNQTQLIEDNCWHNKTNTMDHCPFIWKDFKQKGYATAYAEDEPHIGTFNYNVKGFIHPPTDFYFRPFMVHAIKKLTLKIRDTHAVCLGPTSTTDHFLKYAMDLLKTISNPLFALIWLNNFSHNNFNTPAAMDVRMLHFMQELTESGSLNNTLVVFFSDHGARFGEMRKTYVGWLEERLPFIYIWVPAWYREKYPDAYQNLVDNGDRLTSPYDLHLLLKDVLDESAGVASNGSEGCSTCVSLFTPVSRTRSCDDAGITPHWCTCASQIQTSTTSSVVQNATIFAIKEIGQKLSKAENSTNPKCAVLRLNNIFSARLKGNSNKKEEHVDYVIVFDTLPGLAMFDTTVRYWPKRNKLMYEVIGVISRINSYAEHSKCMHDNDLKLYCFCLIS